MLSMKNDRANKRKVDKDDIRSIAREPILKTLDELHKKYKDTKFILVLDVPSIPIISALFTMSELIQNGVVLIEKYDLQREPFPLYHAIYLLGPNTSIANFIKDFESQPKYAAPHLLFSYAPSGVVIDELNNSPVVNRILTFKSLYIQFTPMDHHTFLVNSPEALNSFYSPSPRVNLSLACDHMISGLISFFFSIRSSPLVSFEKSTQKCVQFANEFQRQFTETYDSFPPEIKSEFSNNATLLLIIPRGADPVAPLLHQFTFEAMIYDHFSIDNETVQLEEGKPDSTLSLNVYEDPSYEEYRYVHLGELLPFVQQRSRRFQELHQQTLSNDPKVKTEAIKKISREKDLYNQTINRYSMAVKLSEINERSGLVPFAEYEQTIATGLKDGNKVKASSLELSQQLTKPQIKESDKIRLLAIYNIKGNQMSETELSRNMESAGIREEYTPVFRNLQMYIGKGVKRSPKKVLIPGAYSSDKYNPLVAEAVSDANNGSLDPDTFSIPPHNGKYKNIVLFMIGGISFMELRELNKLRSRMKGTKLWVGSSNSLYPKSFVEQLKCLA
ncbi:putative acetylcholine regulator unc-18 [Histomonas meleagridis]|uniref:putative acetylcholine regulator unc-18 n=1 Tax=Histomonas meleagridis TaxID=135588 RepID=UPI00355ACB6C|nr:putative acetylcholine regulator unc-18 [Histomonas meleagridis]KAH0804785.1 putative acetylcholine regulator unc-18 [Histomonas meleagridis]